MSKMRFILGTLLFLFGMACQSASQEKGSSAETGGAANLELLPTEGAPLFLVRTREEIVGKGRRRRHTYLFLTANGTVYKQYPRGEWVNNPVPEELFRRDPKNTGTWQQQNGPLTLEWPNESPPMAPWVLTPVENGYQRGQVGIYQPVLDPADSTLIGHYVFQSPDQVDREIYAVPGFPQVTFFPDGRFEQNSRYAIMGQYQSSDDPAGDEPYLKANYQRDGYQLQLTFGNGITRSLVVAYLPEEPEVLLIDGHRLVRYRP